MTPSPCSCARNSILVDEDKEIDKEGERDLERDIQENEFFIPIIEG